MKHMKKLALLGAILLTLLLGSCDALFSNKFQEAGLGQVTASKIQDVEATEEGATTLIDESGILSGQLSQAFFDMLKDNPELSDATLAKLQTVFDNPDTQPIIAQAAITLAIQIELDEVSADEVVANAPAAIALLSDEGFDIDDPEDLQKFLDMLLPADITGKAKAFTTAQLEAIEDMIDQLVGLKAYFTKLAANIKANGLKATDLDIGTLAQIHLLVKIMNTVKPLYPPLPGTPKLGASVRAILENMDNAGFNPGTYIDVSDLEKEGGFEALLDDPDLVVLLEAGGLDLSELFGDS